MAVKCHKVKTRANVEKINFHPSITLVTLTISIEVRECWCLRGVVSTSRVRPTDPAATSSKRIFCDSVSLS